MRILNKYSWGSFGLMFFLLFLIQLALLVFPAEALDLSPILDLRDVGFPGGLSEECGNFLNNADVFSGGIPGKSRLDFLVSGISGNKGYLWAIYSKEELLGYSFFRYAEVFGYSGDSEVGDFDSGVSCNTFLMSRKSANDGPASRNSIAFSKGFFEALEVARGLLASEPLGLISDNAGVVEWMLEGALIDNYFVLVANYGNLTYLSLVGPGWSSLRLNTVPVGGLGGGGMLVSEILEYIQSPVEFSLDFQCLGVDCDDGSYEEFFESLRPKLGVRDLDKAAGKVSGELILKSNSVFFSDLSGLSYLDLAMSQESEYRFVLGGIGEASSDQVRLPVAALGPHVWSGETVKFARSRACAIEFSGKAGENTISFDSLSAGIPADFPFVRRLFDRIHDFSLIKGHSIGDVEEDTASVLHFDSDLRRYRDWAGRLDRAHCHLKSLWDQIFASMYFGLAAGSRFEIQLQIPNFPKDSEASDQLFRAYLTMIDGGIDSRQRLRGRADYMRNFLFSRVRAERLGSQVNVRVIRDALLLKDWAEGKGDVLVTIVKW